MKTLTFAAGAAVGYVLGTKAGREKYQQIVDGVQALSEQPAVAQARANIKSLIGQGTTALGSNPVANVGTATVPDTSATVTVPRATSKKAAPLADSTS